MNNTSQGFMTRIPFLIRVLLPKVQMLKEGEAREEIKRNHFSW